MPMILNLEKKIRDLSSNIIEGRREVAKLEYEAKYADAKVRLLTVEREVFTAELSRLWEAEDEKD